MKAIAICTIEFESDEANSENDVKTGIDDYFYIGNKYCGNIQLDLKNVQSVEIKEE